MVNFAPLYARDLRERPEPPQPPARRELSGVEPDWYPPCPLARDEEPLREATGYRDNPRRPPPKPAPRTPWWRLVWAFGRGSLTRIVDRRFRHANGIVRDPITWAERHRPCARLLGEIADVVDPRPSPKGPGPRPVNVPE